MNIVYRDLERQFIQKREEAIKHFFEHNADTRNDEYSKDLVLIKNTSRKAFEVNGQIVKRGDMALLPRNSANTFMNMLGFQFEIIEKPTVASLATHHKEAM